MSQDFGHVQATPPAANVTGNVAAPPLPQPAVVSRSNVQVANVETQVNDDNAHSVLAALADVVKRLIVVAHISEDEKRSHAALLNSAVTVETDEQKQAREARDARIAAAQAALAEAQNS